MTDATTHLVAVARSGLAALVHTHPWALGIAEQCVEAFDATREELEHEADNRREVRRILGAEVDRLRQDCEALGRLFDDKEMECYRVQEDYISSDQENDRLRAAILGIWELLGLPKPTPQTAGFPGALARLVESLDESA